MWYLVEMNERFSPAQQRPTTQTADGLPRWCWTVAEIERMTAAGYFQENDRFELLGGEIVPMSPKGRRHELIRLKLGYRFTRGVSEEVFVAPEPQFNLSPDTYLVPDLLVHPTAIATPDVRGSDALLVVKVAETSLAYDLKTKVALYAAHGVPEYWVINAATLVTTMHRQPSGNTYAFAKEVAPDMPFVPLLVPSLTVSLNALALL
jgi:Uma2 family endonuclease